MDNSDILLRQALDTLEFRRGGGYQLLSELPEEHDLAQASWLEQARELKATAIYFVDDYPTVLFFKLDTTLDVDTDATEEAIRELHLAVWNTSRIPIFFVALPFELRVYNAYQRPARDLQEWRSTNRWLGRVQEITEIAEQLAAFSRPEVESGNLFYMRSEAFDRNNRVDQWLLKNLRSLRRELQKGDEAKHKYVHALIGRSIFIRYLEDRQVLVADYFRGVIPNRQYSNYTEFLRSKDDTYTLFKHLRNDFNGDLFPITEEEENAFNDDDVNRLQDFLLGRSIGDQLDLLFWAYKFDIIPIELISSIYEEFYYENDGSDDGGTHYTPTPLVDFVLSQCLTEEKLSKNPRALDPACGSGIFLVEAFRRMVFYESRRQRTLATELPRETLEGILTQRIVGVDINKAAIQVAAFSLYLAFLDFRNPPDIRRYKQLPRLIFDADDPSSGQTLFCANAFNLTPNEHLQIQQRIGESKRYSGRSTDTKLAGSPVLPLERASFELIIGNPPWGADSVDQDNMSSEWCKAFGYPLGNRELSQCFIWRAHSFIKPGGEVGLLVSNGVFFKHEDKSVDFRQRWLATSIVRAVYNFSHVRHIFFKKQKKDAMSPFAAIFYTIGDLKNHSSNIVSYASIKRNALVVNLQAVVISKVDFRRVRQTDFIANEWLWKTYMWGGLSDVDLIGELKSCYPSLEDIVDDSGSGYEVKRQGQIRSTDDLGVAVELPASVFEIRDDIHTLLQPIESKKLARTGNLNIYHGERLLIKRGVSRSGKKNGEIHALLTNNAFAFTNFIYGFRIDSLKEEQRKLLLGILLSSLAKYYHFLTCSTWGFWHDEVHLTEHLQLPVCMTQDSNLINRISSVVDKASRLDVSNQNWSALQTELDTAVFDLYELTQAQRELITDLCQGTLEYFYDGENARSTKPPNVEALRHYCGAFKEVWNERLASRGKELETRIFAPVRGLLYGVAFELVDLGTSIEQEPVVTDAEWRDWFGRLSNNLLQEYSERIYIDKVVKDIRDSSLLIIKRSEARLWTKSHARQDARELLTQVFRMEWHRSIGAA